MISAFWILPAMAIGAFIGIFMVAVHDVETEMQDPEENDEE